MDPITDIRFNRNAKLALAAMFSAMAVVITLTNITIPFPILPYLKIDFTEIPVIISFYMLGPIYGLITSTIYWIILTIRAGDFLGPAMKYAAVVSMILGYWLTERIIRGKRRITKLIIGTLAAVLVRIFVTSIINYWVILFVAPFYYDFIIGLLSRTGLPHASVTEVMTWTLIITAFYNLAHTILSIVPGSYITRLITKRLET